MKKILLIILLNAVLFSANSQTCYNFSNGLTPAGWNIGAANVGPYEVPTNNCSPDQGIITPGVGGTNPTRILQESRIFSSANPIITLSFDIFVFASNLKCNTFTDFACATYVKVFIVKSSYNSTNIPPASEIYSESEHQLVIANGNNTIVFNNPSIPNGAGYKFLFDFKSPDPLCKSNGKYVLDNFCTTLSNCIDCPPTANNDYFNANDQSFFNNVKGNVLGGFAIWAGQLDASRSGYNLKSLPQSPAVSNGVDGDANNHSLADMTFTLISNPVVMLSTGCAVTPPVGTLVWNGDGSFEYTRGDVCVERVRFTYQITDPTNLTSSIASVTIDFLDNIPLPVKLKSFTASRKQSNVDLKWTTTLEQNNLGFELQRQSGAGGWQKIAFVKSKATDGNSVTDLNYNYTDANDSRGVSQYRLMQIDLDDQAKYSEIRSVQGIGQEGKIIISPNPSSNGRVNVTFQSASAKRDLQLTDMHGRMLKQWNGYADNSLQIADLTPGIYQLRIIDRETGTQTVEKIMVVNR